MEKTEQDIQMKQKRMQLFEEYYAEIQLMLKYCRNKGILISENIARRLQEIGSLRPDDDNRNWSETVAISTHGMLAALIKPVTPRSLASTDFSNWKQSKWVMILLISLVFAAVLGLVGYLNTVSDKSNMQLNFLFAAMIGAAFNSLLTAYQYVRDRIFEQNYASIYFVRFFIGLIAGMIVANLGSDLFKADPTLARLGPGMIALLGGYSAEAVRQILDRLVVVMVTAVNGKDQTQVEKVKWASELIDLTRIIAESPGVPSEVQEKVQSLLRKLEA